MEELESKKQISEAKPDAEFSSIFQSDSDTINHDEFQTRKPGVFDKIRQNGLYVEQVEEQKQRRKLRRVMFTLFFILLIIQHGLIAWFVGYLLIKELISDMQPLLAIIIPATLGETYAIINVMVKFIFSPGNFEYKTKTSI